MSKKMQLINYDSISNSVICCSHYILLNRDNIPYINNNTKTTKYYYLYHEGGMEYGIYTMRETHIAEGDMSFSHGIYAIQNGCHKPLPLNHERGIWDHIPLVIVASDSLRI